jgi:hypothetical protein
MPNAPEQKTERPLFDAMNTQEFNWYVHTQTINNTTALAAWKNLQPVHTQTN